MENRDQKILRGVLAHNIGRLRRRVGWSQDELAHKAKINRTYLAELEKWRRNVGIDNVEKLARAFEVDPIELFLSERAVPEPSSQ